MVKVKRRNKREKRIEMVAISSRPQKPHSSVWLILFLLGLHFLVCMMGFGWGLHGYVPWAVDGIEGITIVREWPKMLGEWTYKYPRLQFLIDGLMYKPFIEQWKENPVSVRQGTQIYQTPFNQERLQTLALVSRINILVMSTLVLMFIFLITRFYSGSTVAGFFAALSLCLSCVFVYYSHTTCVDIPSALWITSGAYFLLRGIKLGRLRDHILSGVCFAFACGTKDAMLFYTAAFGIAYVVLKGHANYKREPSFWKSVKGLINRNSVIACVSFLYVFALIQNILWAPKAYLDRMGFWVGGKGVVEYNQGFQGHWPLLLETLKKFYTGMGWPLILLFGFSIVFTFRRNKIFYVMIVLFPLLFFYAAVTMQIKMSFIRYYLPVLGFLFIPVGIAMSECVNGIRHLRNKIAFSAALGLFCISFLYCIALDYELINDSRNQAANWFKQHVPSKAPVLMLMKNAYAPHLGKYGFPVISNMKLPALEVVLANQDKFPDYIVYSKSWLDQTPDAVRDFIGALHEGKTSYEQAACFTHTGILNPKKNPLSLAAWPFAPSLGRSPRVIVMKRQPSAMSDQ